MQLCGNRLKVAAYAARQRDRAVAWMHLGKTLTHGSDL